MRDIGGVGVIVEADYLIILGFGRDGGEEVGRRETCAFGQTAQHGQIAVILGPFPEGTVHGFVVRIEEFRGFVLNISRPFQGKVGAHGADGSPSGMGAPSAREKRSKRDGGASASFGARGNSGSGPSTSGRSSQPRQI